MGESIFADNVSTTNLQASVDSAIKRIKTITTAFSSETLAETQYSKAVKSLNFAISQLEDAQCMVEDSIHGSVAYNNVVEDGSIGNLLMSNIATAKMSAQLCISAMMSDIEEDMSLDDALDIGDDAENQDIDGGEPNIDDNAENQDIDGDEPVKDVKEQVKKESSNKSDGNTEDTEVEVTNIGSSEGEKVENKDPDVKLNDSKDGDSDEDEDEEGLTLEELKGSKDEDHNEEGAATTKHSNQTLQDAVTKSLLKLK